ncbi:MAG TPA: SCO family protein [Chitinophagaceae bacterium]|nr:SCO family protein [Chitinophagaceae bacterium]
MKKKALLALLLAILLPAVGYLLTNYYSKRAIQMPSRYFYDSIKVTHKNGNTVYDTAWHHLRNIHFINQFGKRVSFEDLKGKIIVLDFFFTRCPSICPRLAKVMKKLQNSFTNNDSIVQFVSVSVDPVHDSVPELRKWAERFNVDPDSWWLLTGNRDSIYTFGLQELKASIADPGIDTAFIHSEDLFLLDKERIVRGWYNGFDTLAQKKLVRDIPLLMLEKDRKRTFGEFLKDLFNNS